MAVSKKTITIKNADDYFASLPDEQRNHLLKLRQLIKAAAPGADEGLTYQTPAYRLNGLLVGIASAKTHTGFYVMSEPVMKMFKEELKQYDTAKTSIRFPLTQQFPEALIKKIVKARIKENLEKNAGKK